MSRVFASIGWSVSAVLGFVAFTASPAQAVFVTPTGVVASSEGNSAAVHLIDSSGMTANTATGQHDDAPGAATMWTAGPTGLTATVDNQFLEFDLGALYDLSSIYIWQYNQRSLPGRQTKQFDLLVSTTLAGAFTPVIADQNLILAQNNPTVSLIPAQTFSLTPRARRVRLELDTAWSGSTDEFVGLSEVRFEALAPEPTAGMLLLTGVTTLLLRRRHGVVS